MSVTVETLLKRSDDRLGAVHPRIREYSLELIKRAFKEGIRVQISSGFRSKTDQAYIYGQGRPGYVWNGKKYGRAGSIVSNAKPGSSVHNYGLAIDYFLVSADGKTSIWVVNNQWKRVAAIAKSMGFEWGGDWKSFRDYPHLQITGGLSISQLAAGRVPTIKALSGVTPVVSNPIKKDYLSYGDRNDDVKAMLKYLAQLGYTVDTVDFYNATAKKAVMQFQKDRGLEDDGIYGAASKAEMNKALKEPAPKPDAETASGEGGEITVADIIKLSTGEGRNAQLRVLKRFEKKDPALSESWRLKVEAGTFDTNDFAEVMFVAIDRGYISGKMSGGEAGE